MTLPPNNSRFLEQRACEIAKCRVICSLEIQAADYSFNLLIDSVESLFPQVLLLPFRGNCKNGRDTLTLVPCFLLGNQMASLSSV